MTDDARPSADDLDVFGCVDGLSFEDRVKAAEWMGAAREGGEFERSMLNGLQQGYFRIRFTADGQPEFTLTEKGRELALLLMKSSETKQ